MIPNYHFLQSAKVEFNLFVSCFLVEICNYLIKSTFFFFNPLSMSVSAEKIIILDSVDSTNNYAMGLIKKGSATHSTTVFAIDQTKGKGRRGRAWITEPGANVQFSIVTQMNWASLSDKFFVSMAASLSVARLIRNCCDIEAFVKWPNDIIINDKKAAGILIETVIQGASWQWAVTGIGLNVNQKKFSNEKATSLSIETSRRFDVLLLAGELRNIFLSFLDDWKNGKYQSWLEDYNNRLFKRNQKVKLRSANRVFETLVKGVTREGRLQTEDSFEQEWDIDTAQIRF